MPTSYRAFPGGRAHKPKSQFESCLVSNLGILDLCDHPLRCHQPASVVSLEDERSGEYRNLCIFRSCNPDKEWPGEWLGPPRVFRFFSSFLLFFLFFRFPFFPGSHRQYFTPLSMTCRCKVRNSTPSLAFREGGPGVSDAEPMGGEEASRGAGDGRRAAAIGLALGGLRIMAFSSCLGRGHELDSDVGRNSGGAGHVKGRRHHFGDGQVQCFCCFRSQVADQRRELAGLVPGPTWKGKMARDHKQGPGANSQLPSEAGSAGQQKRPACGADASGFGGRASASAWCHGRA